MKPQRVLAICVAAALITFGVVSLADAFLTIDAVTRYDVRLSTSNQTVGVTVDNTTLDFGVIPVGGTSMRELVVTNNFDHAETVHVDVQGNVARLLQYNTTLRLAPLQTQTIAVRAIVPEQEPIDMQYTGRITIIYKGSLWRLFT